jgi:hypothetical protein
VDTDNAGYNLSPDQFGHAYFRDHHERLGMAEPQVGAILEMWYRPDRNKPPVETKKRLTVTPDMAVVPNQTHVHIDKVAEYLKKPSKKPIGVVKNPDTGDLHVLDGHHRITADRLAGRSTKAVYWEL